MKRILGNIKLSFFLAFKSMLKGNRWALALIVAVMAFSFVNLNFTTSIISGVMSTMDNQMIDTVFSNLVISPRQDKYYIDHVDELQSRISQVSGVTNTCSHLISGGFIEYGWKEKALPWDKVKSGNWNIMGIDPEQEARVTTIGHNMMQGTYLDEDDNNDIILGVEIAGGANAQSSGFLTLGGIQVGDKVRITYDNGVMREYNVKGIFRAREAMQADHLAFVTRKEMVSVLGRSQFYNRASEVLVKADRPGLEDALSAELKSMGVDGEIRSWKEYGAAYRSIISAFEIIGTIIGSTGLFVAAIVMFIVIYINVLSKKRQIGILRAIGIPRDAVLGSYLVQALSYAVFGIVIGWLLIRLVIQPILIVHPIELPFGNLSLHVDSVRIMGSAIALGAASVLAGLIPSWAVMRESIIKTIWGV
jgi:putative ABC transport system permease protein